MPALIAGVVVDPLATGSTAPIPLLILNVVAFVVVHESIEVDPDPTVVGLAVSVHAGVAGVTMAEETAG